MSHTDKRHTKPAVPNQKSKWRDTVPLIRPTENAIMRAEENRDDLSPEIRQRLEASLIEDANNDPSS